MKATAGHGRKLFRAFIIERAIARYGSAANAPDFCGGFEMGFKFTVVFHSFYPGLVDG